MPALIIETSPDGSVRIAATQQVPAQLMADAETVESVEEAAKVVLQVLGSDGGQDQGQDGGAEGGDMQQPGQPGAGGPQGQEPDGDEAAMEQGFNKNRRAY